MRARGVSHYAAPAAFLLAATIAILLVRAGLHHGGTPVTTRTLPPPPPRKTVATATTKPAAKHPAPTAQRFYTVVAGDTFGTISSKTGVPVVRIQQLNPNVQSTALYIGQKIRVK
jgi:LysM repeat protein